MAHVFDKIDTWLFDLDETLYPPSLALFEQIDAKMTRYVMEYLDVPHDVADQLRADYWRDYGTTLAGLMENHGMAPGTFLDIVHDIDLSHIEPDHALISAIDALPGRKLVFTNGSLGHAKNVTTALGMDHLFEAFYSIEDTGFVPKPSEAAFDIIFEMANIQTQKTAFFEDSAKNLAVPAARGMQTILVREGVKAPDYVNHHAASLEDALTHIHNHLSQSSVRNIP